MFDTTTPPTEDQKQFTNEDLDKMDAAEYFTRLKNGEFDGETLPQLIQGQLL